MLKMADPGEPAQLGEDAGLTAGVRCLEEVGAQVPLRHGAPGEAVDGYGHCRGGAPLLAGVPHCVLRVADRLR